MWTPRSLATSTPERLLNPITPRYLLVGGKGGVGKTTCAAALAIQACRKARTLLVSTDPAPSLGDVLRVPLSRSVSAVHGRSASFDALELHAPTVLRRWLRQRSAELETIVLRGTWLDREDVARLMSLSLPGIDEIAALVELVRLGRSGRYDLIVVDTAPTGHTLRMLAMPATLAALASLFDDMQAKHRAIAAAIRGAWAGDAADAVIDELKRDAADLFSLLRDPTRVKVSWVTLPEPLATEETLDAIGSLRAAGIVVPRVIVNRTTPPGGRCTWCGARRYVERRERASLVRRLRRNLPDSPPVVHTVAARENEPRGVASLARIGAEIHAPAHRSAAVSRQRARASSLPGYVRQVSEVVDASASLVFFGGKGGVGKTTCAAAAALSAARRQPDRRIVLLSIDPAHSLGDVFGVALTDAPTPVPGGPPNLLLRELDADGRFRRLRQQYAASIDALEDVVWRRSGVDLTHDWQVVRNLIDLAPPGLDELAAILDVTESIAAHDSAHAPGDLLVVDTAPTGHALRLLEMPERMHDWIKALMAVLLKYRDVVPVADSGAMLVRLSRGLAQLRGHLASARETSFVVVTRASEVPRAETARLLTRLRRLDVHVSSVIVNAVGGGECSRCRRAGARERRSVAALARWLGQRHPAASLVVAPGEMPPPTGRARLERWRHEWQRPQPRQHRPRPHRRPR